MKEQRSLSDSIVITNVQRGIAHVRVAAAIGADSIRRKAASLSIPRLRNGTVEQTIDIS